MFARSVTHQDQPPCARLKGPWSRIPRDDGLYSDVQDRPRCGLGKRRSALNEAPAPRLVVGPVMLLFRPWAITRAGWIRRACHVDESLSPITSMTPAVHTAVRSESVARPPLQSTSRVEIHDFRLLYQAANQCIQLIQSLTDTVPVQRMFGITDGDIP